MVLTTDCTAIQVHDRCLGIIHGNGSGHHGTLHGCTAMGCCGWTAISVRQLPSVFMAMATMTLHGTAIGLRWAFMALPFPYRALTIDFLL